MPRIWDPNPDYEAAVVRFNSGDLAGALAHLEAAAAAQPARARIHSNVAVALRSLGREAEARAPAERGAQLADADDPYPAVVLAETLHGLEDDGAALAAADEALGFAAGAPSDRLRALVVRAWSLVRLDRVREAVAAAREAVAIGPAHAGAQLAHAVALASAYRWGEAMTALEKALVIDPGDEDLLRRRAVIAQGLETAEEAAATARADVEAAPRDWQRWLTLGTALTMAGRLEDAVAAFDHAHEHNPDPGDQWPDEPTLLSTWEADCRLALMDRGMVAVPGALAEEAPRPAAPKKPRKPATPKKPGTSATPRKAAAPKKPRTSATPKKAAAPKTPRTSATPRRPGSPKKAAAPKRPTRPTKPARARKPARRT